MMANNYRKIYEQHHGIKIPKGYHIHHIDGNHNNNEISNLEMLTANEHAQKHGFLNNFIMAQSTACERAIKVLKRKEVREKMSVAMKNSFKHKEGIKNRDEQWLKNVSNACRITAKNRTNDPWNKGKTGLYKMSDETKSILVEQRTGRKWYTDGQKSYFIHPENAKLNYKLGRK
jgi:hypothetical protein